MLKVSKLLYMYLLTIYSIQTWIRTNEGRRSCSPFVMYITYWYGTYSDFCTKYCHSNWCRNHNVDCRWLFQPPAVSRLPFSSQANSTIIYTNIVTYCDTFLI